MTNILTSYIGPRSPLRLAYHHARAFIAALRYGFPARKLTVIGITGTDGKTTTVGMVGHILRENGQTVGTISTTAFRINDTVILNKTQKTSVSPFRLQQLLRRMVTQGCQYAVVETSSHGLVQGRVSYIFPKVAALTNISEEHLDYHKSMEQYAKDKSLLFRMLRGSGCKVLNKHDRTYDVYKEVPSRATITYGEENADLWIDDVTASASGAGGLLHYRGHTYKIALTIPGIFNLWNAQCAIACCLNLGISVEDSLRALRTYRGEPGRMQKIDEGQNFYVYCDFTVSPAAYESTLSTLQQMVAPGKRILVLTGSCGDRMQEKRPTIGQICCKYADVVIVTSDETYTEPHEKIIDEICSGIDESNCELHKIIDRRQAIEYILSEANEGDCVCICGMAGATTMMTLEGQIEWDEVEIVKEELSRIKHQNTNHK